MPSYRVHLKGKVKGKLTKCGVRRGDYEQDPPTVATRDELLERGNACGQCLRQTAPAVELSEEQRAAIRSINDVLRPLARRDQKVVIAALRALPQRS